MKKPITILTMALIALFAIIFSCTNAIDREFLQENKDDFITLKKTTNLLSETLVNLGVEQIVKTDETYTFKTFKTFYLLKTTENLANHSFEYKNKILSFKDDNLYQIYSIANIYFIKTPYYEGKLNGIEQKYLNTDKKLNLLLIFMGEASSDQAKNKVTYSYVLNQNLTKKTACSFWDTEYNVGVGLNSAAAKANLQYNMANDIIDGSLSGCTTIGQPETSSIGGVYYSTQAWCCP